MIRFGMDLGRRAFLSAFVATVAAAREARGDVPRSGTPRDCEVRDISVPGEYSQRFTLLVPNHLARHERVPLLVLLHGLGETGDPRLGAFAWIERYGLGTAYDRLRHPPVVRVGARDDWTDARLEAVNAQLTSRPFRGIAIACPFTPDLPIGAPGVLDGFARWLCDVVVPRARREVPTIEDAAHTTIGGCSLGGHFSLEAFLRRPESFGAWGGVQTAIGVGAAPLYANRIAQAIDRVGVRDVFVETSTGDPFRAANEELSRSLTRRGIRHDFRLLPGPHDQPWLRESGTIEMLLWHDERPRTERRVPAGDL